MIEYKNNKNSRTSINVVKPVNDSKIKTQVGMVYSPS